MKLYQSTPTPNRLSFSFDVERVRKLRDMCTTLRALTGDSEMETLREMFESRLIAHELSATVPSEESAS